MIHRLLLVTALVITDGWAAVARTGQCGDNGAPATSCTLSATASGDLIIACAYRNRMRLAFVALLSANFFAWGFQCL